MKLVNGCQVSETILIGVFFLYTSEASEVKRFNVCQVSETKLIDVCLISEANLFNIHTGCQTLNSFTHTRFQKQDV